MDTEEKGLNQHYLNRRYRERRIQIEDEMRYRQTRGKAPKDEKAFQSAVNYTLALEFRQFIRSEKDQLTGLIKRDGYLERLEAAIALTRTLGGYLSIWEIDLDGFKKINDKHGHVMGDKALQMIATMLKESFRSYDIIGRLGGDEFGLITFFSKETNPQAIIDIENDMVERFTKNLKVEAKILDPLKLIDGSFGVAHYGSVSDPLSTSEYLKQADIAMYHAKLRHGTVKVDWIPGMTMPELPSR